jgi:hypothetical protein
MENMDGAELLGKTIYCNFSKPQMKMQYGQAVWSNEEWIKKSLAEESTQSSEPATSGSS